MSNKKSNRFHVVPNSGSWSVKRGGAKRASKNFENKKDAVDYGRGLSRRNKGEFRIHNRDGKMSKGASHGGDPFPPRDKH